jgi:hypothetical protein
MRKITKKRKTNARTKIRKYRTKTNIRKSRKTYKYLLKGGNPLYDATSKKYKQIFGDNFKTILQYAHKAHIIRLIELLNAEKEFPSRNTFNNNEQIDKILEPALENFLVYIMAALPIIQTLLDIYNKMKLLKNRMSYSSKEFKPTTLDANKILNAYVRIPPDVEIDDSAIEHLPEGDKTTRRNLIIVLAGENSLIDEFIRDLQILGKISTSNTDLPEPVRLPRPQHSSPEPAPLPSPIFSSPQRESSNNPITPSRTLSTSSITSSYKDPLTTRSTSPSTSSYESARTYPSRSPSISSYKIIHTSPKAIRKTSYSYLKGKFRSYFEKLKRTIGSKKGKPKLVAINGGGGKNYKTRNKVYSSQKKTRRHKNRNI